MKTFTVMVEKLTKYDLMKSAMEFTSDRCIEKLTDESIRWMYDAEHSPIRTQMWKIMLFNIPTYVSVHLVRHKIGVEHFVKSNRRSNEVVTRDTPVNHLIVANAQAIINMARVRLCGKADVKTQEVMREIVKVIANADPWLAEFLMPTCMRIGRCPERLS